MLQPTRRNGEGKISEVRNGKTLSEEQTKALPVSNGVNRGFILITTTILLSLLMMVLAISLGSATLFTRFGTVDFYNKRASFSAARSCLETARLKMAIDPLYTGNETVELQEGTITCSIATITTVGANKSVATRSQVKGATTNLKTLLNPTTLYAITFEELVQ